MTTNAELELRNRMAASLEREAEIPDDQRPIRVGDFAFHMNNMTWAIDHLRRHFPEFEEWFVQQAGSPRLIRPEVPPCWKLGPATFIPGQNGEPDWYQAIIVETESPWRYYHAAGPTWEEALFSVIGRIGEESG